MQKELKEFGLTDREIEVYLGLLKLGTASVQDISRKSNVYRTYAYEILNSLKEKGLVSYVIKSGKKYFEVAQPGKLINILKDKEVKIRSILPNLEEIYKSLEDIKPSLIDSTLRKLRREKLIILKLSNFFINTNKGAMDTTKNLLKEHWETNWEEEWKNVTAKTKVLGN